MLIGKEGLILFYIYVDMSPSAFSVVFSKESAVPSKCFTILFLTINKVNISPMLNNVEKSPMRDHEVDVD